MRARQDSDRSANTDPFGPTQATHTRNRGISRENVFRAAGQGRGQKRQGEERCIN